MSAHIRRLQDETARIEDQLLKVEAIDALINCFVHSKANSFENLLDPFLKLTRISTPITLAIAKSSVFFKRILDRLGHNGKAVVRLNLLKLLRSIVEVHPNRALLVERYGLLDVVEKLSKGDGAVLVRELAREIVPTLRPVLMKSSIGPGGGAGHATPMVHKLKARAGSVDRGHRDSPLGERGERERDRERDRFDREGSPALRTSISSIGGVTPKLKLREDGGFNGGELRERDREGHREKVILVSRKMRRAASEASATALGNGNGGPRRPVLQTASESLAKNGRERRLVSGLGPGLGLERSTNAPPTSVIATSTSSMAAAALSALGSSQYKPRLSRQKLDDVAAWLERDSGLGTD